MKMRVIRNNKEVWIAYDELTLNELMSIVIKDYDSLNRYLNSLTEDIQEIKEDIENYQQTLDGLDALDTIEVKNELQRHLRKHLNEVYKDIEYMTRLILGDK